MRPPEVVMRFVIRVRLTCRTAERRATPARARVELSRTRSMLRRRRSYRCAATVPATTIQCYYSTNSLREQ